MTTSSQRISEGGPARPALFFVIALFSLISFVPRSANADWLVLTDGTRLETSGSWEVRGRMLVFHDASGNLSSMRVSNVDLEASRQLTAAVARKQAAAARKPAEEKRESVLRITDADVSHIDPATGGGNGASTADDDGSAEPEQRLAVESWDRDYDSETGDLLVRGNIRNGDTVAVRGISVFVIIRNDAGVTVGRSRGRIDRPFLKPTEESTFVATFPGISDFATAEFRVDGTRPAPVPGATDTSADDPTIDGSSDSDDS